MNIPKQREIFKLGFQIQICQPKKGKNANIITTNTGSISNKYSIYDQFAHDVPNKKKKKTNLLSNQQFSQPIKESSSRLIKLSCPRSLFFSPHDAWSTGQRGEHDH